MQFVDTHCHIQEVLAGNVLNTETRERYKKAGMPDPDKEVSEAKAAGVTRLICVGTNLVDSQLAVSFVAQREGIWASIGIHPHEAKGHLDAKTQAAFTDLLVEDSRQGVLSIHHSRKSDSTERRHWRLLPQGSPPPNTPVRKVVAIGECGLDYYYNHSSKEDQEKLLRFQLELAQKHQLPVIFHVRDAFDDFWPIFDEYKGIRGVIHSFSAGQKELEQILQRGLYVGLNGIMTFTKNSEQLEAAKQIPIGRLLLETDAPFLTPSPHRDTICSPRHVRITAEFLAALRDESLDQLAAATTQNARDFFGL